MNQKPHIKPYLYGMLAGFGAISLSVLFFFVLYRFDGLASALGTLISIVKPFIYGAVIAYLLKPVCNWFEDFLTHILPKRMQKAATMLAVLCSLLVGLLLVYALVIMIVPKLVTSIITLSSTIQTRADKLVVWAESFFYDNEVLLNYIETGYNTIADALQNWAKEKLYPTMQNIVSGVGLSVWNAVIVMKNLFIGIVVAVYLLAARKTFAKQAKMLLYSIFSPRWAGMILQEVVYADKMFGGFINGKLLDSFIIGVLCYIGCLLLRFPNPLLLAAIIGVTNVIPIFGPFIGAVPTTLLILIEDPIQALWFVLFVLALQQLDGNIIGPKILGSSTGLSSFWVLFSILLFGGLWGFIGMLIGVPLFAVIYDVVRRLVYAGLRRNGCEDFIPFGADLDVNDSLPPQEE